VTVTILDDFPSYRRPTGFEEREIGFEVERIEWNEKHGRDGEKADGHRSAGAHHSQASRANRVNETSYGAAEKR
jgi:hypothetical protein